MKKTIKDYNLENKRVIIRCDLNVPLDNNKVIDDTRIKSSIKTIKYAIDNGAKVILLSHLGKVKEEKDKKTNSLYPTVEYLSKYLNTKVLFSPDTRSEKLTTMVNNLKCKEVLLVENTRFEDLNDKKESNCDLELSKYWASLGDIFINDAYASSHRSHASVVGIAKYLPNGIGFLIENEITKIDTVLNSNEHPFIVISGGKKIDDKLALTEKLLEKSDKLLIGGAMSFTFLKALGYNTGNSLVSEEYIDFCVALLKKYPNKIVLPIDFVVENNGKVKNKKIEDFDNNDIGYDIGPLTIALFKRELKEAKRVILNGPMGMFEKKKYQNGTKEVLKYLSKRKIKIVVGGGDTAASVNKFKLAGKFYHVSTGGGATLKYLENENLVGIEVINDEK